MTPQEDLRRTANDLWKHAVSQIEDVRGLVRRTADRLDLDVERLRDNGDRVLRRLGEHASKLSHQDAISVPSVLRRSVDRLTDVLDRLVRDGRNADASDGDVGP